MELETKSVKNRLRLNQIVNEIDQLKSYYEEAERMFPYKNISPSSPDEHQNRSTSLSYENLANGKGFTWNLLPYGLLSMYGFTKMTANAGSLLDLAPLFKHPLRSLAFFFYGGVIGMGLNYISVREMYP